MADTCAKRVMFETKHRQPHDCSRARLKAGKAETDCQLRIVLFENSILLLKEMRAYSVCQARAACSLTGKKMDEGSGCMTVVAG
jgi:hypothetical protein